MRSTSTIAVVTAAVISIALFTYPDYTQDMLDVSRQTIGALGIALITNFVVAVAAGIMAKGTRTKVFLRVLCAATGFTVVVFVAVGFWADLYAWRD